MNDDKRIAIIEQVLQELRPAVQGHSGDLELVTLKDNVVFIRLRGACVGCPSSFFTLKFGVEQAIKKALPDIKEIVAVD